jgi:hypothetical protein
MVSYYVNFLHDPKVEEIVQVNSFAICTTCFELTSLGQTYQHCACETPTESLKTKSDCPNGFLLCQLCARQTTGGRSRFSWLVCPTCKVAADKAAKHKIFLAIARHSQMLGMVWSTPTTDVYAIKVAIEKDQLDSGQKKLKEFGIKQAKELYASNPNWAAVTHIPIADWRNQFPTSSLNSRSAILAFFGLKTFVEYENLLNVADSSEY